MIGVVMTSHCEYLEQDLEFVIIFAALRMYRKLLAATFYEHNQDS